MNLPENHPDDASDAPADARLQSEWMQRQQSLGNVPQAVLLRNLPAGVNGLLDSWHRSVLRWSLSALEPSASTWIADLGCGYGRMASETRALGFEQVVGLDYEAGFCRQYQLDFGYAVRGSIADPPFTAGSLAAAYAVTAFMYVGVDRAAQGLRALDACLQPGARILLLEAGSEFNTLARMIFRGKRRQSLAVNGFSRSELGEQILPKGWRTLATGCNPVTTLLLPLLLLLHRFPRVFGALAAMAMTLDRPRTTLRDRGWRRLCLHRWVLCEKPGVAPEH
jgi:SAM-dependent methyltransferase